MLREMAAKNIILDLLISVVLVYGVVGERNILPENTSSEQLRAKHKLPVKTVTTEHGDVYDCIDFFEQPAFDHPLLKNHDYHFNMKPNSIPKEIPDKETDKMNKRFKWKSVGCPRGTVPIRRTNRENSHLNSQTNDDFQSTYYAGTKSKDGIGRLYGASSSLSIENPKVYDANQYSSSIISIDDGPESLRAGWTVNPLLYGDYNTRFYIWTKMANVSCYNTNCPGFVIVNTDHPLDQILMNANNTSGPRRETKVFIYQDKINGNWWLVGDNDEEIGFWPKRLFNTLSNGANKVYYGGVVATPLGSRSFPEMGRGNRPENDKIHGNALSRHMTIVNQDYKQEYAADKSDISESLNERYVSRNLHMHWYNRQKYFASTLLFGGY